MAALLVPGHTLVDGGRPWLSEHCSKDRCATNWTGEDRPQSPLNDTVSGPGHAHCSCGWESDHLPTGAARKRTHRAHKIGVLESQGLPVPA